ncbi:MULTISPECIES: hypothetical protein [unclassified Vibrio]|nr:MULTISPECIES: hypothetical protein [unclassified Vibrio]NAW59667.1 hypothetical protein [Vibrio sp. V36_P2S2PM302]NAX26546.1 hypothetical protein [Vibrio sp. V38_P2S17PM301]
MDWEVINGITSIVGAICSVLGLGYFSAKSKAAVGTNGRIATVGITLITT